MKSQIPRQISFVSTVQLFNQGILQMIILSGKVLKYVIDGLLNAIVSISIGQQKRTAQPRAIKRRPKPYTLLTESRHQAYEAINM